MNARVAAKHSLSVNLSCPPSAKARSRKLSPIPGSPSPPTLASKVAKRTASFRVSRPPVLTPTQRSLLRKSWNKVGKFGPSGIGSMIFRRIFDRCPSAREMFGFNSVPAGRLAFDNRFQRHARVFVGVLEDAIKNLDKLETEYAAELIKHGANHVRLSKRGFRMEYWDVFAEALTETAMEWTSPGRGRKETIRAWTNLVAFIIDQMRFGYELELKNNRKRSPSPAPTAEMADMSIRKLSSQQQSRTLKEQEEFQLGARSTSCAGAMYVVSPVQNRKYSVL